MFYEILVILIAIAAGLLIRVKLSYTDPNRPKSKAIKGKTDDKAGGSAASKPESTRETFVQISFKFGDDAPNPTTTSVQSNGSSNRE